MALVFSIAGLAQVDRMSDERDRKPTLSATGERADGAAPTASRGGAAGKPAEAQGPDAGAIRSLAGGVALGRR